MPEHAQIPLPAMHWCDPIPNDDRDAVRRWQAHLEGPHESTTFMGPADAGRLGTRPSTPPAITARDHREPGRHRRAVPHLPQPPQPKSPRMTRPLEHPLVCDSGGDTNRADPFPVTDNAPDTFPEDSPKDFDVGEAIAPGLFASRRADGWTAERQRAFCEAPISF